MVSLYIIFNSYDICVKDLSKIHGILINLFLKKMN